jgi:GH35 family endo-1,4-beta-xylanase
MKKMVFLLVTVLTVILLVPVSCGKTPSPLAQDLSAQIAGINLDDTTALTSLFQLSDEIDQAQSDGSLSEREGTELQEELMAKFTDWVNTREERLGLSSLPPAPTGNITWPAEDSTLLDGADERIEQYRMGDATIEVVDADGDPVSGATVSLDMLKHDFLFGTWVGLLHEEFFGPDSTYRDTFARLFNYATIGNFWSLYEPAQGQVDQLYLGDLMDRTRWAKDCGMTVVEHNLVYIAHAIGSPIGPPAWVQRLSQAEVDDVLQEHVTSFVTTFSGLTDYWIALNEPTNTANMTEPLRSWMLANTPAGAEALTLEWAHTADPEVKLIINDWEWYPEQTHQILEDVVAAGAPFDAIGFQTYMTEGNWTLKKTWDIFELLDDFNVPLQLTELEVQSGDPQNPMMTSPKGEAIQAEYLSAFYTLLFSHPSMQAITYTWFSDFDPSGAPGGLLHVDMVPKPAYYELMRLIHQEWWTNAEATTNTQGEATVRGFYGQYLLTIESGTKKIQMLIHLEAGQDNIFEVQLP